MPKEEGGLAFNPISPCATAWPPSWCDSCRAVPCSVYCRADAAYLCGSCDTSIHSANTLAGRHHRVPVLPIQAGGFIFGGISAPPRELAKRTEEQEGEEDGFLIEEEVDEYLDLVEFSSGEEEGKGEVKEKQNGCDECEREVDVVVPVQCLAGQGAKKMMVQSFQFEYEGFAGGIDYSTAASSVDHNVSLSSMETAGVTEGAMIDISSSHSMASKGTMEHFSGPILQLPHMASPMDREARVLRYREKKKTRKFQKIIRYASRKAYAETRPRIKGRFAKRKDVEDEVDQMFAAPAMIETSYGVVPSC